MGIADVDFMSYCFLADTNSSDQRNVDLNVVLMNSKQFFNE